MGQEETAPGNRHLQAVSADVLSLCPYRLSASALERVLLVLQKEKDPLFDLNVPKDVRIARPEQLLAHLWSTYRKETFEVTGEEAVQRHLQPFDEVEYIGTRAKSKLYCSVQKGTQGTVEKVFGSNDFGKPWVQVGFYDQNTGYIKIDFPADAISQLVVHKGFHRRRLNSDPETLGKLKANATVEYVGDKPIVHYIHYVPPGAHGIVRHIQQTPLYNALVLWRKMGFLVQTHEGVYCQWDELKILRKNEISIEDLLGQYAVRK